MKTCSKCKTEKPFQGFSKSKNEACGYHSHCKMCNKEYRDANKELFRNSHLKSKYGIDLVEYNQMFAKQDGRCAICGRHQSEFKHSLAVDHCHETGEVRGLLCSTCNRGIGYLQDDASVVLRAASYLAGT